MTDFEKKLKERINHWLEKNENEGGLAVGNEAWSLGHKAGFQEALELLYFDMFN